MPVLADTLIMLGEEMQAAINDNGDPLEVAAIVLEACARGRPELNDLWCEVAILLAKFSK